MLGVVSILAHNGDAVAERALWYHYAYLAQGTANLAVCVGAKGVFWAGDNQRNNNDFVQRFAQDFVNEFLHHPKRAWLEPLPIYVQKKEFNFNLEGTVTVSRILAKRGPISPRLHFDSSESSDQDSTAKTSNTQARSVSAAKESASNIMAFWNRETVGTAIVAAAVAAGVTYFFCKDK